MIKANLGIRVKPLSGYINLDPTGQPNESDRVACNLQDLAGIIDANELEEFLCSDTLDFIPLQARQSVLTHWLTRVAHGGLFVLTGNDIFQLARVIHNGTLGDLSKVNEAVYRFDVSKKSAVVPEVNLQIIMSTGQFVLESVKYLDNKFTYCISVRRK